ncbi:MAG: hypothetical protein OHK006_12880 [Thermodesulfovibrionales bacterium]
MSFDPVLMEQARREIAGAPYGHRGSTAHQWAVIFGVSVQHLYRLIGDPAKQRSRASAPRRPELHAWAETIFQIKKRPPEEAGEISTEDAVAIGVRQGLLPAQAADVPAGTFDRIARDRGWNKTIVRAVRFQAGRPNQAHHFDASTSKFFYIAKKDGSDYILRIHRPAKHYKNKPIPVDSLRPWIYGLVDDHSGRLIARYTAAAGETSGDSISFLAWAWSHVGLCEQLLADQGMLKKALPSKDLIERLGVELPECMPYAKRAHGKIERPWRTIWQKFELTFFAQEIDWDKFQIKLSELNAQLATFIDEKYNRLPHRFERNITRMQAWSRVNLHGGIVQIPEGALATVARRARRKVGVDGTLQYGGSTFEVKGLHDAWVFVYEGVFTDRIMVQEIETGRKFEVRDFRPLDLGQYRAHPASPHERLLEDSAALELSGKGLYARSASDAHQEGAAGKVVSMPIRTKEERTIEDPLSVTTFASIAEAMKEFMSYLPGVFLSTEERREVKAAIEASGLDRRYVENLALEVRAGMSRRAAM